MVITSSSPDVNDSASIESSESVEEPPIRPPKDSKKEDVVREKADPGHNPSVGHLTREEVSKHAHTFEVSHLAEQLGVDLRYGLSNHEAAACLEKDGPNKLEDTERISMFQILLRQVSNSLTVVLLITMILSFVLHDYTEGSVITAVIVLNIVVGFIQDYRAEKTILSLQALSTPECKVLRGSQVQVVKAETLVVGDIVHLTVGDVVPADLRLFDGMNMSTDEALLTGESLPISKHHDRIFTDLDMPVGDRVNMAYSASMVSRGRGSGLVIATGMLTEVGKIATLLQAKKPSSREKGVLVMLKRVKAIVWHALGLVGSPLQVKLSKFALLLFGLAILLAIIVFSAASWDIQDEVLIYGICVAVAVIPESLIAVLTLTIAVGTKAMAKSNIIIRKLSSLEAVGGVTNVCSDKTGTLTQGKMIVRRAVIAGGETLTVHDSTNPFDPTSGTVKAESSTSQFNDVLPDSPLERFLDIVSLCNLSTVQSLENTESQTDENAQGVNTGIGKWTAVGEPTEIALQVFAMRFQHGKAEAMNKRERVLISEFPFDSSIKRMTMAYSGPDSKFIDVFTKGATEALLPILTSSDGDKEQILAEAERMAGEGLRVLCLAHKAIPTSSQQELEVRSFAESDLTFAGLIGLYDPPRAETAAAVVTCQRAGITVHMLTGDHIRTATAIAAEVNIIDGRFISSPAFQADGTVMPASEFDKLSDEQVDALDKLPLVIARCSPSTKVRMVQALHRRKCFCIMTGDGINDSPALKLADIGIAMGLNGSDVAKQAADMVLADDDFASIVRAIQEGRRLFDNIQKFLLHLLTSNIAQVILLLIALAFQDARGNSVFPLSPLEILWANLVTSSPLAIGLGLEPAVADIMSRPPRSMRVGVFTRSLIIDKMVYGVTMGSLCLIGFVIVVYGNNGGGQGMLGENCNQEWNQSCTVVFEARATVFAILTFTLLMTAWEVKDFNASLFHMKLNRANTDNPAANNTHGLIMEVDNASTETRDGSWVGRYFSVFGTLYSNRFLFWACITGFLVVFPLIYVPALNLRVFKHKAITWEWGIVIGLTVVYVCVIEAWKAVKRSRARKMARRIGEGRDKGGGANVSSPEDGGSVLTA